MVRSVVQPYFTPIDHQRRSAVLESPIPSEESIVDCDQLVGLFRSGPGNLNGRSRRLQRKDIGHRIQRTGTCCEKLKVVLLYINQAELSALPKHLQEKASSSSVKQQAREATRQTTLSALHVRPGFKALPRVDDHLVIL